MGKDTRSDRAPEDQRDKESTTGDRHPLFGALKGVTRIPPGHPEGYLEGFANIYAEVALAIKAARSGKKPPKGVHFPTIDDGVKGLAFIEAAVKSSKANGKWVKL